MFCAPCDRGKTRNSLILLVFKLFKKAFRDTFVTKPVFQQKTATINEGSSIGKKKNPCICKGFKRVEVAGFEPAAFWSRTKRATKLRYTSESISSPPRRIHRDGPYTSQ